MRFKSIKVSLALCVIHITRSLQYVGPVRDANNPSKCSLSFTEVEQSLEHIKTVFVANKYNLIILVVFSSFRDAKIKSVICGHLYASW